MSELTVRNEWLEDPAMHEVGIDARVLSIALVCMSNKHGHVEASYEEISNRVFRGESAPLTRAVVAMSLLESIGFVDREESAFRVVPWSQYSRKRKLGKSVRRKVLARDNHRCAYCGADLTSAEVSAHVDHVFPSSRGGSDDPSNLVASCESCNCSKGARTPEEWLQ